MRERGADPSGGKTLITVIFMYMYMTVDTSNTQCNSELVEVKGHLHTLRV